MLLSMHFIEIQISFKKKDSKRWAEFGGIHVNSVKRVEGKNKR